MTRVGSQRHSKKKKKKYIYIYIYDNDELNDFNGKTLLMVQQTYSGLGYLVVEVSRLQTHHTL